MIVTLLVAPGLAFAQSWSVVSVPKGTTATLSSSFNAVACPSASFCTAVGSRDTLNQGPKTLIETWDGSAWSVVASPNPPARDDVLNGVSCASPSFCVAVGDVSSDSTRTLVETWNGSAWSRVASPNPSPTFDQLNSVSCASSSFCVAVGTGQFPVTRPLIEAWDGSRWSQVALPHRPFGNLNGVSCPSLTFCEAVGIRGGSGRAGPLTETWNGSGWSAGASMLSLGSADLAGVSCVSAVSCTAVGSCFNVRCSSSSPVNTFIEAWNGSSWSRVASPDTAGMINELSGVACTSATSCVAVGLRSGQVGSRTLIETWNGSSWVITQSPNKHNSFNDSLKGVACSAGGCTAAGSADGSPLIESE